MTTNIQPTTATTTGLTNQESTFVAAILSSMAAGNESISNNNSPSSSEKNNNHYSIPSSTPSGGTAYASTSTPATLTPNLGNLQQAFIELQSVPSSSSASVADQSHYAGNHSVDPSVGSYSQYDDSCDEDSSAEPRALVGKIGSKIKEEKDDMMQSLMRNRLCPEEEERRRIRRERNKIAAAKCRQRRVDHTNRLIQETEKLEEERATLQDEIQTLRQQKDQLEFILQAHRPLCKAPTPKNTLHDNGNTLHDVKKNDQPTKPDFPSYQQKTRVSNL